MSKGSPEALIGHRMSSRSSNAGPTNVIQNLVDGGVGDEVEEMFARQRRPRRIYCAPPLTSHWIEP